jgi:hypothetical protein
MIAMAWPSRRVRIERGTLRLPNSVFGAKSISLDAITRIDAKTRDAFTHDEIFVHFSGAAGENAAISEFDAGFGEVMRELESRFPGIAGYRKLNTLPAFAEASVALWPPTEFCSLGGS